MFKMQDDILLNQYVQGVKTKNDLLDWFNTNDVESKRSILIGIWSLANQARVNIDDVENARNKAGLKTTHTPVRMLYSDKVAFKNRGYKLANLIGKEQIQAFLLILNCFSIAEERRKERCDADKENCNHWWHKDLSDPQIIEELMKNN